MIPGGKSSPLAVLSRWQSASLIALVCLLAFAKDTLAQDTAWERYSQDGIKAYKQGRDSEAERLLRLAVKESEQFGANDLRVAQSLRNLAMVLDARENYAEAESVQRRVLSIKEKVLGQNHREVASTLNDLGVLCYDQAKYAEGEACYRRALEIDESMSESERGDIATTLENYAKLLRKLNRPSEAEQMSARAQSVRAAR